MCVGVGVCVCMGGVGLWGVVVGMWGVVVGVWVWVWVCVGVGVFVGMSMCLASNEVNYKLTYKLSEDTLHTVDVHGSWRGVG